MAVSGQRRQRLSDGYSSPGFKAQALVRAVLGQRGVRVITLLRRSKTARGVRCRVRLRHHHHARWLLNYKLISGSEAWRE